MKLISLASKAQKTMMFTMFVILSLNSCGPTNSASRIKIDSGDFITKDSANKVDGVFSSLTKYLGASSGAGCTGTAVSSTTAMTAAHCVYDQGDQVDNNGLISGKEYCITNSVYKTCSSEIYVNPSYIPNAAASDNGTDFAWVVFPEGTFKSYFKMNTSKLEVNDEVLMVGYSEKELFETDKGSKRFGYNKIQSFQREERSDIITEYGGKFESVAVSPGDSGGPIMKACQITGVASRMSIGDLYKISIHTNLTDPTTAATLRSSKGYFCGLSGEDEKFCPKNAVFAKKESATQSNKEFPCEVKEDSSTSPNNSHESIFAALNESNDLYAAGSEELASVTGCFGKTLADANACDTELTLSAEGKAFKTHLNLDNNGTEFFVKLLGVKKSGNGKIEQVLRIRKK